ncbi:MAG TPA: acyloxyacyl hydrolase [Bacteroidia bacterium]|nr:acyloxyacyl hydrolase [Bacteroidia bacterium]
MRTWSRVLLWTAFLLLAGTGNAIAQVEAEPDSIKTRLIVGARAHYGFVLIHSYALDPVRHSFPWGAEMDIGKQFVGKRAWDFCNCYPRAGAALTFWDYGSEILGYGATAMWYVEPVFLTRYRLNLSIRLGSGLSYQTHPYDSVTNPNNLAYSLRINVPVAVGLALNFRLNPHWSLRLAGNFNHVSNGGLALPNKGINYPTVSLGADYAPQGIDFQQRAKNMDKSPPKPRLRFYAGTLGTLKRASGADTRQNRVWGIWSQGVYHVGRWSGLSLGLEWVNDGARKVKMQREGIPGRHERGGVLVGHQFLLGRVIFSQQLGIYFFDQFQLNDPVYQRYGLGLHVTKRLFAGFSLKTHRHVADLLDLRLAWGIW